MQEGARKILMAALEEEVNEFLGRLCYQRRKEFRGYRNGYLPPREVTIGFGAVEVRMPRVAKVPPEVAPQGFQSQIVRRYERASERPSGGYLPGSTWKGWPRGILSRCSVSWWAGRRRYPPMPS